MRVILCVLCAILCVLCVLCGNQSRLRAELRSSALRADSVEVLRDSTRVLSLARSVVGDSVRVVQRRALQVAQRADSLDRALGLERVARYRIQAQFDDLAAWVQAPSTPVDSVVTARFAGYDAPYHYDAKVTLPRGPGDGEMTLKVSVDSALLEARVGCGVPGPGGVRPATLTLSGPRWVQTRIQRVEQEARVCSPVAVSNQSLFARIRSRLVVSLGVAVVGWEVRPAVGAGIRLW